MQNYTLYNGDCLEYIKKLKSSSIDLIVTDPPYNLGKFMENRDTNLGKMRDNFFGIAACREIEDMDTFLARCNDTVKDSRGVIIPLVDSDFIYMLDNFEHNNMIWEDVLQDRFHKVCVN